MVDAAVMFVFDANLGLSGPDWSAAGHLSPGKLPGQVALSAGPRASPGNLRRKMASTPCQQDPLTGPRTRTVWTLGGSSFRSKCLGGLGPPT